MCNVMYTTPTHLRNAPVRNRTPFRPFLKLRNRTPCRPGPPVGVTSWALVWSLWGHFVVTFVHSCCHFGSLCDHRYGHVGVMFVHSCGHFVGHFVGIGAVTWGSLCGHICGRFVITLGSAVCDHPCDLYSVQWRGVPIYPRWPVSNECTLQVHRCTCAQSLVLKQ